MIYGVGIDVVDVSRIEKALERWGDRFIKRVYTPSERTYCQGRARSAARFALRFAAKEAFVKALGVGLTEGIRFPFIEVMNASNGRPCLNLYGRAKECCKEKGVERSFLSLSDDGPTAVAVVVLEK
jgi:holo-[acyl-carrier protein] synthase